MAKRPEWLAGRPEDGSQRLSRTELLVLGPMTRAFTWLAGLGAISQGKHAYINYERSQALQSVGKTIESQLSHIDFLINTGMSIASAAGFLALTVAQRSLRKTGELLPNSVDETERVKPAVRISRNIMAGLLGAAGVVSYGLFERAHQYSDALTLAHQNTSELIVPMVLHAGIAATAFAGSAFFIVENRGAQIVSQYNQLMANANLTKR